MQMVDTLPAVRACINNGSISTIKAKNIRDFGNRQQQMSTKLRIVLSKLTQRDDRLFRNEQHMHRSLRSHIAKRQAKIVFIDDIRRYFAVDDFKKDCQRRFPRRSLLAGLNRNVTRIVGVDEFSCN